MGYRPELKVFRLSFEDRPGLEVAARSVTLEQWMAITGLDGDDALSAQTLPDGQPPSAPLRDGFTAALVSWNIEDKAGQPVPAAPEGLAAQPLDLVRDVIRAWLEAVSGVIPPDLGKDSGSGETSEEASLGLANSSKSLPSSAVPG